MLDMRPSCETCDEDLPADREGAMICSFECTYCEACTRNLHKGICPNCGGGLVARPMRMGAMLQKYPASTKRVFKGLPNEDV